jgi:hypothetical protein
LLNAQLVAASASGLSGSPAKFSATAAATKLVITLPPAGGTAGSSLGLVVTAEDASGNVATSFSGAVSLAFGANAGADTLFHGATVNAVAGVATFTSVAIGSAAAGYTLVASSNGLTSVTTGAFPITAAAPALITKVGGDNQSGLLGVLLPTPLAVLVTDRFGNPVSGYAVSWAVKLGNATLVNLTSQTNSSGIATNTLKLGLLGSSQITATVAGVVSAVFNETGIL